MKKIIKSVKLKNGDCVAVYCDETGTYVSRFQTGNKTGGQYHKNDEVTDEITPTEAQD